VIELNDFLNKVGLDPRRVMVMRHRPTEKALRLALPTLAAERPEIYNTYQSQHGERVENSLSQASHLVSFIGHEAGRAMFIGLYEVAGFRRVKLSEFWNMPGNSDLKALGTRGPQTQRTPLWFDLRLRQEMADLKGRLVVEWPGIERSWWRWASRNRFPVATIHEESRLVRKMPRWNELVLSWSDLQFLPTSWRHTLSQWRGIYFIFDTTLKQGYVGSACGTENIIGRWMHYSKTGHGGNRLLRKRNPGDFLFSILELVAPSTDPMEVVGIENLWKQRLHTRAPMGLNDN
jgi:hypothetical protein